MKKKNLLKTIKTSPCKYLGAGMDFDFESVPYCMKMHDEPTEIHLGTYCSDCPDFDPCDNTKPVTV